MAFYAPDPIQSCQLIPGSNTPASGALLFCYQVGTTVKQNTYTDQSASTARTNPIVLDSGGNIPGNGEVWIASSAKFVLAPSNDTDPPSSPYWTRDNLPGLNDVSALVASSVTGEWVQGSTATFVGVTLFSLVGDQSALYTIGRRIKAAVTGGNRFGIVTSAVVSGGSTSVGVTLDSSTLNAGLNSVQYGLLGTPNGSIPWTQLTSTGAFFEGAVTTGSLNLGNNPISSTGAISGSGPLSFSSTSAFTLSASSATPTFAGALAITSTASLLGSVNYIGLGNSGTTATMVGIANVNVVSTGSVSSGANSSFPLASYTLPANALFAAKKGVEVIGWGTTANNNNPKSVEFYYGNTTGVSGNILDIVLTASTNPWRISGLFFAAGPSTQIFNATIQTGTGTGVSVPVNSGVLSFSNATTTLIQIKAFAINADNDIVLLGSLVRYHG